MFYCALNKPLIEGKEYILSATIKITNSPLDYSSVRFTVGNGICWLTGLVFNQETRLSTKFTYTPLWNAEWWRITIALGGNSIELSDLMITEATTEDITYKPAREPITYNIPPAVQALNAGKGIAGYADTIDIENKKYIQRCNTVALTGDEEYTAGEYYILTKNLNCPKGKTQDKSIITAEKFYICFSYKVTNNNFQFGNSYDSIFNYFADLDAFKAYLKERYLSGNPVTITYELAEPIVTEFTWELDNFDNLLQVESGGSLEFVNENGDAVPSSVTYLLKEGSI